MVKLLKPCPQKVSKFGSFQEHRSRRPPSKEPGVDYAAPYGTKILAAEAGVVSDIKRTNDGAMGRYVRISLDDGRTVRYLHLSEVLVGLNKRVKRGTLIGRSGGSGFGKDRHYDSHVHVTLWTGRAWESRVVNFDGNIGGVAPAPAVAVAADLKPKRKVEDDDMIALRINGKKKFLCALGPGIFRSFTDHDPTEKIKNLMRIEDDWQNINLDDLNPLLRTYGCKLEIWDLFENDTVFGVLDPLNGTIRTGNMWSAAGDLKAAVDKIKLPVINQAPALDRDKSRRDAADREHPGLEPVDPLGRDPILD